KKSSSYRQWYHALEKYSQSKRLQSQKGYWSKLVKSFVPLNVEKEYAGDIRYKDTRQFTQCLDVKETQQLLQEVHRAYNTEINDILLCALAITLCKWSNKDSVIVGLEGHGRESIM